MDGGWAASPPVNRLAPDIQEAILWLPAVESGDDPVTERELRDVVAELNWEEQRRRWREMVG
jgi:hypothetical protein